MATVLAKEYRDFVSIRRHPSFKWIVGDADGELERAKNVAEDLPFYVCEESLAAGNCKMVEDLLSRDETLRAAAIEQQRIPTYLSLLDFGQEIVFK